MKTRLLRTRFPYRKDSNERAQVLMLELFFLYEPNYRFLALY